MKPAENKVGADVRRRIAPQNPSASLPRRLHLACAAAGDCLVIGYGNTLRGDDGVGSRVAEAVAALALPGVRTLVCAQLSPEHADPIAQARTVIFVDAAVDASRDVRLSQLEPADTSQLMAHAADPRTMLALARDVFGRAPAAWLVTIPVETLAFSEALSPVAQRGLEQAVREIQKLGEWLSVSLFETQRDLRLVVCQDEAEDFGERLFDENPSPGSLDKYIWNDISKAFARPINREDLEIAYVPTQILAEVFKTEGFDGIAYRSGLAKGTNVVLFNRSAAKPRKNNYLYGLKKVRHTFVADPRFAIRLKKNGNSQDLKEITSESP